MSNFMNQTFTDILFEAGFLEGEDSEDDRIEVVIHDRDRREHQAIIVEQDPEKVADRFEQAAKSIRDEMEWREDDNSA